MEVYLLILSIICLAYWYWKCTKSSENLPPGPIGIPVLGYLPSMNKKQHLTFSNLKSKYGDIFCFYIGQQLIVVLSSYKIVKDALTRHGNNFATRPVLSALILPESPDLLGISINSGKLHTEFKQIALSTIKSFTRSNGFGESTITNEIKFLCREIDKNPEEPTDIQDLVHHSTLNIISQCLFGERNDPNDEKIKTLTDLARKVVDAFQTVGIEFAFPQLLYIPFVRKILQASTILDNFRCINKYFDDKINELDSSQNTAQEFTFIHEWLKLYPKDSAHYEFYRKQLPNVARDLFFAGMETTSLTLQWAILYMIEYPDVQQKVRAEIKEVIGIDNTPSVIDKIKMPYTEATRMEIQRITPVFPFTIPYLNPKPAIINGYTIPENSIILANLWEILHDPKTFPNPHEFRPDRFLEHGELKRFEELIPFSIGKRQCIGESLARMELFLFFTALLHRYTFKKPDGVKLDLTYDFSFLVKPRPYKVIIIPN